MEALLAKEDDAAAAAAEASTESDASSSKHKKSKDKDCDCCVHHSSTSENDALEEMRVMMVKTLMYTFPEFCR